MIKPDVMPPSDSAVWWFIICGTQVLASTNENSAELVPYGNAKFIPGAETEYTAQIGDYRGKPAFVMSLAEPTLQLSEYEWQPLRQLLRFGDSELFALAGRACQLQHFLETHQYCGKCGSHTVQDRDELAVLCPQCEFRCYPRISPCMIVAVYRGKQILLARGVRHPEGLFSVLAGFVESGESFEQCVHREVFEEVGVRVRNIRYVTSQPWPFPHSLMAGFIAEYDSGELNLQDDEIISANWFDLDQLPRTPPLGTIAARLIATVKAEVRARS